MTAVTQSERCHENDETASVRRARCRVANEASLKQVVALVRDRAASHDAGAMAETSCIVYTVDARLALCTDVESQSLRTSTNPDLKLYGCHSTSESEQETIFIMLIACR